MSQAYKEPWQAGSEGKINETKWLRNRWKSLRKNDSRHYGGKITLIDSSIYSVETAQFQDLFFQEQNF